MLLWPILAALLALAPLASAQSKESAPAATSVLAGFVQYVEGQAQIQRSGDAPPSTGVETLRENERLITGDGRAELTLSVGSFVRVGPHSELEMIDAGLRAAHLRLHRGEVVLDVSLLIDDQVSTLRVGEAVVRFEKSGLYRVALGEGNLAIQTFSGRASYQASGETMEIKGGKALQLDAAGAATPSRASEARKAPLLTWTKDRRRILLRQALQAQKASGATPVLDDELRHMENNRPVGTVVVGP